MSQNRIKTGDQALIRQINLSIILDQLRENAPISRAALAEKTGLNKTTVSSLVSELIDMGLVVEIGLDSVGVGRPSVLLTLNPRSGFLVSAEIGVDFINIIATDFTPRTIYKLNRKINPNQEQQEIIEQVLLLLQQTISENARSYNRLLGVAVGVPGLVDFSSGTVLFAPNLHWKDVRLGEILQHSIQAPVLIDNDANLAALGEYSFGAARSFDDVVYISAGAGIGGGIIMNGAIVRGKTGFSGEFGHMTLDPDGPLCACGNHGCWETFANQHALFEIIRRAVAHGQHSSLSELVKWNLEGLNIERIVEAAYNNDELAQQALYQTGQYLGIGIASLVNALNPELVVLGGSLSLGWEWLKPGIEHEVQARALRWHQEAAHISPAFHGPDACLMGGVAAVYDEILPRSGDRQHLLQMPVYTVSQS
jgi:glucokinase-like ROK family protein